MFVVSATSRRGFKEWVGVLNSLQLQMLDTSTHRTGYLTAVSGCRSCKTEKECEGERVSVF